MEHDPQLPRGPVDDSGPYVGLLLEEAERRAQLNGWMRVRTVTSDTAAITMDWVVDRINFVVADGRVTDCWFH